MKFQPTIEMQWPSPSRWEVLSAIVSSIWLLRFGSKKNTEQIEHTLKTLYGVEVKLFPSGRSAISGILSAMCFGRDKTVFITKYSSFCLYQSIGYRSNVSTDFHSPQGVIVNHKWGKTNYDERLPLNTELIIEDSCDSQIFGKRALFPNKGHFEIVSLTKVLGAISGAVVLINPQYSITKSFLDSSKSSKVISYRQFFRKIRRLVSPQKNFGNLENEQVNWTLNALEVASIRFYVNRQPFIENLMKDRIDRISKLNNYYPCSFYRIGPGVVIKFASEKFLFDAHSFLAGSLIRHFDLSLTNDNFHVYEKVLFLPIHSKISSEMFEKNMKYLENNQELIIRIL